jgi:hypothetical protein
VLVLVGKSTVSNPRFLSAGGRFFLADSSIEFFRYISGIFVKNELARSMAHRFGHDVGRSEMACVFYLQHLHHRAMYAVDGEILHTPGDAMGILNPGQASFRLITAFLYDPFA